MTRIDATTSITSASTPVSPVAVDAGLRQWFDAIRRANRQQLLHPPVRKLSRDRGHGALKLIKARVRSLIAPRPDAYSYTWTMALNAQGAVMAHRVTSDDAELQVLRTALDQQIDANGKWRVPIDQPAHTMKGYAMLLCPALREDKRYRAAADALARFLIDTCRRGSDGCLPYTTHVDEVLVDTLAMICPLLSLYGKLTFDARATALATQQLREFVRVCVDSDTALPYHGYYPGGASRLGMHGWGRGVGWYLMGLIDTLENVDRTDESFAPLRDAAQRCVTTCLSLQRPDGHWNWGILHRDDVPDSSTTSLLAYALARGSSLGLLNLPVSDSITRAVTALRRETLPDGLIGNGLGECRGLGKYPQTYGPQPWLQGSTVALAAWLMQPRSD